MKETINEFLKFRSRFTKREWFEINQVVEARLNEKADQLKLDDIDIEIISKRLERKNDERYCSNHSNNRKCSLCCNKSILLYKRQDGMICV